MDAELPFGLDSCDGNTTCADCVGGEVAYAVLDLGILVCSECAAVHATKAPSMPAHVHHVWIGSVAHAEQVVELSVATVEQILACLVCALSFCMVKLKQ
jgi:hypothetical protein